MGPLVPVRPAVVVCTRDRARAIAFYRDTLELPLLREDDLAAVFDLGCGATLRIGLVADFVPHGHTMLGFEVPDVRTAVGALGQRGVTFRRIPGLPQDDRGILTLPGGTGHVAWFDDPDGNILSLTDT